jgi:O-acetylserine/cysteine efflux transporter
MPARHLAIVLLICVAWGGNFLFSAFGLRHFPPFLFTALRFCVVLTALLPFLRPLPLGQRRRAATVAIINGVLHFGINFVGLRMAGDITSVAVALQSYIPMSALLARPMLGERIAGRTAAGIGVAFFGVLVLGFDPIVLDAPLALGCTLVSAFMLALGTTLSRHLRGIGAFQMQAWTAVFSLPLLLAVSAVVERDQLALIRSAGPLAWGGVAYSALAASICGHAMLFWLVQRHPVSRVTPYLLLTPLFAAVLGVVVWGDRPGPEMLAGGALVLAGVLVVAVRGR